MANSVVAARPALAGRWSIVLCGALLGLSGVYHLTSVLVGWNEPLTDAHAFRQTQTAVTAHWLVGRPFRVFSYETPVLGPPWQVPFEFPLYQSCVAALVTFFGTPVDQTGRLVSLAFFWMTLVVLYFLLGRLEVKPPMRCVILAVILLNPFYLFWSRCVLIESTALLCCMAFLNAAAAYVVAPRWWKLVTCVVLGTLAGLTKITTFVPFAGAALLFALYTLMRKRAGARVWMRSALAMAIMVAIPLLATAVWTAHADALKEQNPFGRALTSRRLFSWNVGTLQQRLDIGRWYYMVLLPLFDIQYHSFVLLGCAVAAGFARSRVVLVVGLALCYLSAPAIFAGVHQHSYYLFANLIFALIAMGFCIVGLLEQPGWRRMAGLGLLVVVVAMSIYQHRSLYLPLQRHANPWAMRTGRLIRQRTRPEEVVIVVGLDWSPEVPYYAQRRAVMIPWFAKSSDIEESFRNLGDLPVGALVVGHVDDRGARPTVEYCAKRWKLAAVPCYRDGLCELFFSRRYEPAYQDYREAKVLLKEKKVGEARKLLDRAIALVPDDPQFFLERAMSRQPWDDMAAVCGDLDRAAKVAAQDPAVWFARARMLWTISQSAGKAPPADQVCSEAMASMDRCISLDPVNPDAYAARGEMAASLGQVEKARDDAAQATRLRKPRTRYLHEGGGLAVQNWWQAFLPWISFPPR